MEELSLYILDLIENAVRAGATLVQLDIMEDPSSDEYIVAIADNGAGIPKDSLGKANDPSFVTSTSRKIGLGLSMMKQAAEMTEGKFVLESEKGKGKIVKAHFKFKHIDLPELGDIEGTLALLIASSPKVNYIYNHRTPNGLFNLDTRDIKKLVVSEEFSMPAVRHSIRGYVRENLNNIKASL